MNSNMIKRLAKEAGMVEGPWANGNKERIWQENREFPDALEVFASLVAAECSKLISKEIITQSEQKIYTNIHGLNQAIFIIKENFSVDIDT